MSTSFATTFTVEQTPEAVYAAINNVRGWWSEVVEGVTDQAGQEFYYHHKDLHKCWIRVTELTPNQKVVWLVLDNYFNFISDQAEWKNTEVIFEIARVGDKTEVHFEHRGLVPEYECYEICSNAWGFYINTSLRNLITTGKGQPNSKETSNEVDKVESTQK